MIHNTFGEWIATQAWSRQRSKPSSPLINASAARPVEREAPTSRRQPKWWEYVTNNKRKAIILSPVLYDALIEMLSDQLLKEEADRRMAADNSKTTTLAEMMNDSGITEEDMKR